MSVSGMLAQWVSFPGAQLISSPICWVIIWAMLIPEGDAELHSCGAQSGGQFSGSSLR